MISRFLVNVYAKLMSKKHTLNWIKDGSSNLKKEETEICGTFTCITHFPLKCLFIKACISPVQ